MKPVRALQAHVIDKALAAISFQSSETAQTLVEYGLIIMVIILVTLVGVSTVGYNIKTFFYDKVAANVHS